MIVRRNTIIFDSTRKLKGALMNQPTSDIVKRLRGPITRDLYDELASRNRERVRKAIEEMGDKWIGHPARFVTKKEEATT